MSAITRSPAWESAGGKTSGIFGAASVTVIVASIASPGELGGVGRETGRQIDRDDRHAELVDVGDDRLEQAGQPAAEPGAEHRVDDDVALGDFGEVQLPLLRVGDLDDRHADAAEHLEVDARVALHVGDAAEQEDRSPRRRAAPACARPRSRRRRCCRGRTARRPGWSRASSNAASIAATVCRPAFSISTIDGRPMSSIVRRSASRICSVFSTRIGW